MSGFDTRVDAMHRLLDYLASIHPGPIPNTDELEPLLAACWDEFDGSSVEGMSGHKLHNRIEDAVWRPPILSFTIERHGATVMGSTRAELQHWEIDVEARTATGFESEYRQLYPMQPRLDVRPMAEEIARLIIDQQQDERLKWNKDGSVRVQIGKMLPAGSAVRQTLEDRRKRFRKAVDEIVSEAGWRKIRANVYAPPDNR
jgi:hypothetical protein